MLEFLTPDNLLKQTSADEPFAIFNGTLVSRGQFWADVHALASQLPNQPYLVNLCENRYLFCIGLLAAMLRRQVCLLPPSGQLAVIEEIMRDYPDAYLASEKPQAHHADYFEIKTANTKDSALPPCLDWERPAVIAFTSGSTGHPKPCAHSLKTFAISASMAVRALGLAQTRRIMISTTPPQHMYGLETSVFWPLFSTLILHDGRPFFPEDIRQTVANAPFPAILTTTPTHLRSLVKTDGSWDNLAGVVCATDTLTNQLAGDTAAILGQSPCEIYGSTETLSFAFRKVLVDPLWQPYADVRINQLQAGQVQIDSPHLPAPMPLQDRIETADGGKFEVLGRHGDMIKIGGKRTSLPELNRRLLNIAGVEDGFCFLQSQGRHAGRIMAVVVSSLDQQAIRAGLKPFIDEVFLPRKILFVAQLPRNAAGKLSKTAVDKLIAGLTEAV